MKSGMTFNQKLTEINFKKYNSEWIERTAQIIFLNRTCYNGLFRVNRKGEFNVPFGRYKNPDILNEDNLKDVATLAEDNKDPSRGFHPVREICR